MAQSGQLLQHPVTGERIVWRRVSRDTGGALLAADMFAPPGTRPAAAHVHPFQEERFDVVRGVIRLWIDGEETTLSAGEQAVVAAGRTHTWSSLSDEEALISVEVASALRTEMFFETFFGLASDGKTNGRGLPNPLRLAVLMREYESEMRLARPSATLQRVLFAPMAALGRALGYRGWYPAYSPHPLEESESRRR